MCLFIFCDLFLFYLFIYFLLVCHHSTGHSFLWISMNATKVTLQSFNCCFVTLEVKVIYKWLIINIDMETLYKIVEAEQSFFVLSKHA